MYHWVAKLKRGKHAQFCLLFLQQIYKNWKISIIFFQGDSLILECTYDSTSRTNVTYVSSIVLLLVYQHAFESTTMMIQKLEATRLKQ